LPILTVLVCTCSWELVEVADVAAGRRFRYSLKEREQHLRDGLADRDRGFVAIPRPLTLRHSRSLLRYWSRANRMNRYGVPEVDLRGRTPRLLVALDEWMRPVLSEILGAPLLTPRFGMFANPGAKDKHTDPGIFAVTVPLDENAPATIGVTSNGELIRPDPGSMLIANGDEWERWETARPGSHLAELPPRPVLRLSFMGIDPSRTD
jgi:hypothetical protein